MIITKNPNDIADTLKQGGIIAYPTEAVWGIGCDPFNEKAVNKILKLKERAIEKGMILIVGDPDQLTPWSNNLSPALAKRLTTPCHSPTTWVVNDNSIAPTWIRGAFNSTAIRLSQHKGVQSLCAAFNGPIVSTSANPATKKPATSLVEVLTYFSDQLDAIYDQPLGQSTQPSQIKHLTDDRIVRE